jgi:hypothetical protein
MKEAPHAPDASDALQALVDQFADPLSFFRELVQNAVDAGSREVEIRFAYREASEGGGTMVIHVDDWGEGMDRAIIDTKLTRLFSSTKEDDLTKIGRFGIGFVSVFAIRPDAVCIDTSRGGENWRVLFDRERKFLRIARDAPVDGTKIQVIKAVPRDEFEKLRARAREIATYWCKHLPVDVRFDGTKINRPLDVAEVCTVRHEEQGTEVVAGYTGDGSTFAGYYNRGLTLLEERESRFPGVAFKISSRYLEHTLTRDNVIRDANFEKAMAIVGRVVRGPLAARLLERLEEEAARAPESDTARLLYGLAERHLRDRRDLPPGAAARQVFRDLAGRPLAVAECREAARRKRLYAGEKGSPAGEALAAGGNVVVDAAAGAVSRALAALAGRTPPCADALYCRPLPVDPAAEPPAGLALRSTLYALLRAHKARLGGVAFGRFAYPGSPIAGRVAITQHAAGELTELDDARRLGSSLLSRRRTLVLNVDHEVTLRLAALAAQEPELAAYLAAKLFLLGDSFTAATDSRLATLALEARCRRRTA